MLQKAFKEEALTEQKYFSGFCGSREPVTRKTPKKSTRRSTKIEPAANTGVG